MQPVHDPLCDDSKSTDGLRADLRYGLGKLFPQAFVIVIFGGRYSASGIFGTAVSRVVGICVGVLLYLLAAIFVFQNQASERVCLAALPGPCLWRPALLGLAACCVEARAMDRLCWTAICADGRHANLML